MRVVGWIAAAIVSGGVGIVASPAPPPHNQIVVRETKGDKYPFPAPRLPYQYIDDAFMLMLK